MQRLALLSLLCLVIACGNKDPIDSGGIDNDGDGVVAEEDCDDNDPDNFPGNAESCDGADNDCDGLVDDDDDDLNLVSALTWYADSDADGYGDPADSTLQCEQPDGSVDNGDDCDPADADIHPGADEYCNGTDDDCNGTDDDDYALDALTFYEDGDDDQYGNPDSTTSACSTPDGFVDNDEDCDDTDGDVHPGADEYCNGTDDDCNGTDDDDYALDVSLWHIDDDGDGFGDDTDAGTASCEQPSGLVDNGLDCDDSDGAVNPDADEICDGVDNDCDSGTSEDGMASFDDGSTTVDVSSSVNGSSSSPASYTVSTDGELSFCDGTFYVNLTIEADVDLTGFNGDATTAILDGGADASVIGITTDAVSVRLSGLTLQNGYGSTSTIYGDSSGGAIQCEASSTGSSLTLDGVILTGNEAYYGGAISAYLCDVELTDVEVDSNQATLANLLGYISDWALDTVVIQGNDATDVAGAYFIDGTIDIVDTEVSDNAATDELGGIAFEGSTVTLENVVVDNNSAISTGGGVFCGNSTLGWTGTSSNSSGVAGNTDDTDGGVYLNECEASFDTVDFGTNTPYDITLIDSNGYQIWYQAEDDASFDCDADECDSATTTTVGSTNSEYSDGNYLLANAVLANDDGTLMSFAPYTLADSSCDMDFYFMENSSFTGSGWTVIWADTGNGPVNTSSHGYEASGRVGIPVESGTYYAMAWTSLDCDTGYAGGTTNSSVVTGMGAFKSSNCLYIMSPSDTYSVGDTVDATLGCSSGFSLAMTVDVTNL